MADFHNKRILVTGGSGFVGSHMAERMVREGATVYVLAREDSDLWRIEHIRSELTVVRADIRDQAQVLSIVRAVRPEYVFHMAAYGVDSRQRDCFIAAKTNILGVINLVSAIKAGECRKVLNIGSCMEYGNKLDLINEEAVLEPFNIYGSTKAAASIVAHQMAREKHLSIVTLRAFGIFGENEGSHKFFPHIILSILQGGDVNLTACEQYRDYCYIDNIIDAFVLAAGDSKSKNTVYNVGSGTIQPLKYYVDLVFAQMQSAALPKYGALPYRSDEVWKPHPDIAKIRKELNWKPRVSLVEGLQQTIGWYQSNQNKYLGTGR